MSIIAKSKDGRTYRLYTKKEIKASWKRFRHLNEKDAKGNVRFVICRADTEEEALVLTAMIMRKADLMPNCMYYDHKPKKLYICIGYTAEVEETAERCGEVIKSFMGLDELNELDKDWAGEPLFWSSSSDAESFYRNRNFPHNPQQKDHGGINIRIHSHIPPEYAGII